MLKRIVCILCMPLIAKAQVIDTLSLDEVWVRSTRFSKGQTGFKHSVIDSLQKAAMPASTLADLLAVSSPVFIRNYGPSSIATASFRGATAEQTAVIWNGFAIQNALLGLFDFSLYPALLIDDITIQHGGNGALYGSGAVGGSIHLESTPVFGKGWQTTAMLTTGSFGLMQPACRIRWSNSRHDISVQSVLKHALNNFTYQQQGQAEQTQSHARNMQYGIMYDHHIKTGIRHTASIHVWYQHSDREIPKTWYETVASATQTDQSFRIGGKWQYLHRNQQFILRSGMIQEQLLFRDPLKEVNSKGDFTSWINEVDWQVRLHRNWVLQTGLHYTYTVAQNSGYVHTESQYRFSAFYALKWKYKRLTLMQSTRMERNNLQGVPVVPLISATYQVNKLWNVFGNIATSYRMPSLNERFWFPGGNAELKPETGWNSELGMSFTQTIKGFMWRFASSVYYRNMNNQIVWLPSSQFPTATNLRRTEVIGNENSGEVGFTWGKWSCNASLLLNILSAKNKSKINETDNAYNKNLIYTPRITQQYRIHIQYHQTQLSYMHTYTGMQYTTTDNMGFMPDFSLGNVVLAQHFSLKSARCTVMCGVFNVWNKSYQIIENRPMPGINYQLTLKIQL